MPEESHLLKVRRHEVEQELARLKERVAKMETELAEIDTAERVLARLHGAGRGSAGTSNKQKSSRPSVPAKDATGPSLVEMILAVLADAQEQGKAGLEPREISDEIDRRGWGPVKRDYVRTRTWRLMDDEQLVKIPGTALYSLPLKSKTVGDVPGGNPPTVFSDQPKA